MSSQNDIVKPKTRDFLTHLETFLAKRDGVDKLLKISRYTTKILLSSKTLPPNLPITTRLKSFESSVGLSRKAFRLGKFVQDINAFRNSHMDSTEEIVASIIAYGGEGLYYFVEQIVWLSKSGLIDNKHGKKLGKISDWAELIGYVGGIWLKMRELKKINEDIMCLEMSVEIMKLKGGRCIEEIAKLGKLREKLALKKLSVVQDFADGVMALSDIRDGKGKLSDPLLVSCAGFLSALISTRKNWVSC